nr:MAG TPA: hypothetical protein [Caudoviricetes sp.]
MPFNCILRTKFILNVCLKKFFNQMQKKHTKEYDCTKRIVLPFVCLPMAYT